MNKTVSVILTLGLVIAIGIVFWGGKENSELVQNVEIKDEALKFIIDHYTREAGVRNLERQIAALFRKVAKKVAEHLPEALERAAKKAEQYTKGFWAGGNFFEEMGFPPPPNA